MSFDKPSTSGFRSNCRQTESDSQPIDSSPKQVVMDVEDSGSNEEHSTTDETTFMVTHELREGLHLYI